MSESFDPSASQHDSKRVPPEWQKEEWKCIGRRRGSAFPSADAKAEVSGSEQPDNLTGLALSGGGIRSALFNDGFLQALSHRGLLRYVDYLCSVSGGGYIAGHLISQSDSDCDECFHDDAHRRNLGRDPKTGETARNRLPGIGGYLSRPLEFIPAYLWSLFFSLAFYFGLVGILATFAALFWRSFDNLSFRQVYANSLGLLQFGDELTIAFLPVLILIGSTVVGEIGLLIYRLVADVLSERFVAFQRRFRATMLLLVVFSILASIAIFLGNGKSFVSEGTDTLYLNRYVQYFAIAAGIIQVLVFFGRDRLFRSERGEAKSWQRYVQQTATTVLLVTLVFSMVHWMGREGISGYTKNRDQHLVVGDVLDWPRLAAIEKVYDEGPPPAADDSSGASASDALPAEDPLPKESEIESLEEKLHPPGLWHRSIVQTRFHLFGADRVADGMNNDASKSDLSEPPPPDVTDYRHSIHLAEQEAAANGKSTDASPWLLPARIVAAAYAYWKSIMDPVPAPGSLEQDDVAPSSDAIAATKTADPLSITETIDRVFIYHNEVRQQRRGFLELFNKKLKTDDFTFFLLTQFKSPQTSQKDQDQTSQKLKTDEFAFVLLTLFESLQTPQKDQDQTSQVGDVEVQSSGSDVANHGWRKSFAEGELPLDVEISELIQSGDLKLRKSQVEHLTSELHALRLGIPKPTATDQANSPVVNVFDVPHDATYVNRLLLEGLYPKVIQQYDIASTLVVPPHDQRTRRRWLLGWTLLMLIGLIGGLGPRRVATVFHFYRRQLSSNFLVPTDSPEKSYGDHPIFEMDPCGDGLPYPLILAAALEPTSFNGSYRVAARPFVFSPKYCGSFEENETPIDSLQVSFATNSRAPALTLADAITLSGAAVTPLMTQNRWLTIILDFFNTGIGQRVRRTDRPQATSDPDSSHPWILLSVVSAFVGWICWSFLEFRWALLLVVPTTALFCHCWNFQIGSPGWIHSLCFLKETFHQDDFNQSPSFYIADGGYVDYLGVSELLRRRCELIVVSDAGANVGDNALGTLATMCEKAAQEQGIRFLDLDHEAPIDFGRLEIDSVSRLVHQPFLCMRVRYPEAERPEALLVYCQMSITASDPIEIQNIRNLFPSFPDEPTVNQFYNEKQVAAYRSLGYHIGSRFCSEIYPWFHDQSENWMVAMQPETTVQKGKEKPCPGKISPKAGVGDRAVSTKYDQFEATLLHGVSDVASVGSVPTHQPLFCVLRERLLTSYRLACYQEITYHKDDIFAEAIWTRGVYAFPTLAKEIRQFSQETPAPEQLANYWLKRYEFNADLRSAYRKAVLEDINSLGVVVNSYCGTLWSRIHQSTTPSLGKDDLQVDRLAAHLTCVAVACQEIHQGRPSAVFQVGGRGKLIDLCQRIARVIVATAPAQAFYQNIDDLFRDLDSTIAELIEMERSIFQGGEHVATVSFAQCMSSAWGKIARQTGGGSESVSDFTLQDRVFHAEGVLGMFEQRGAKASQSLDTIYLMTAEIRHQLDVGMKEIRLKAIRHGLAKSWYLGFFTAEELEGFKSHADWKSSESPQKSGDTKTRSSKKSSARK